MAIKTIRDYQFLFNRAKDKNKQMRIAESFAREHGNSEKGKPMLEKMAQAIAGKEEKLNIGGAIRETFNELRQEQNEAIRSEGNKKARELRKRGLIERFKKKLFNLSEEELDNQMEKIVVEADRVYGGEITERKEVYTQELTDKLEVANKVARARAIEDKELEKEFNEVIESSSWKDLINKSKDYAK